MPSLCVIVNGMQIRQQYQSKEGTVHSKATRPGQDVTLRLPLLFRPIRERPLVEPIYPVFCWF